MKKNIFAVFTLCMCLSWPVMINAQVNKTSNGNKNSNGTQSGSSICQDKPKDDKDPCGRLNPFDKPNDRPSPNDKKDNPSRDDNKKPSSSGGDNKQRPCI